MKRPSTAKQKPEKRETAQPEVFQLRPRDEPAREAESQIHLLGEGIVCDTEARGHATPQGRSPDEIVLDASEGFIPLWAKNTTLRWRFRARSMNNFANPAGARREIRKLFAEAVLAWGNAAPIRFTEDDDLWDFEIVMRRADDCNPGGGCVLASAFFPDAGRHAFEMYPRMFTQSRKEQVDTFIHEIGHIFGLRHFFAEVSETAFPSEIFGRHNKFSIMNYGNLSELTADDKTDLRRLYQSVWKGELTEINGTPIRLVKPFSTLAPARNSLLAIRPVPLAAQSPDEVAYADGDMACA
jgi:Matrixin